MATKITNVQIFQPTQTSGCVLWLDGGDASTMYTDIGGTTPVSSSGQSIAYWRDKSTSANHATNATNQPTVLLGAQNKLPLVNFNGSQYLNLTVGKLPTGSTPFTFFFLVRTASSAVQVYFTYGTATNGQCVQLYYNNYILYNDLYGAAGPSDNTTYNGTYALMATTASATVYTAWDYSVGFAVANNVPITLNTGSSFAYVGVGQVSNSLTYFLNGQIAEVISYNRVVSTFERQQIEGYLAWKWGVQANLPASHPYINYPPYASPPFPAPVSIPGNMTNVQIFQPTQFPRCQLWLDASRETRTGTITSITDLTANAYVGSTVSATVQQRYLNNLNVWYFPSYNLRFNAFPWRTRFTVIFLLNTAGFAFTSQRVGGTGSYTNYYLSNNCYLFTVNGYGTLYGNEGSAAGSCGPDITPKNQWVIMVFAYNGGTQPSLYRFNGVNRTNVNTTGAGASDTTITDNMAINGSPSSTTDNSSNTYYAEHIHYNTGLSLSEIQQVEGYLAWKWGLQANLPASHPFKNYPPYALPPFPSPPSIPRVITRTSFQPNQISGIQLWIDGSDKNTLTLSTGVSQWNDKSGNGYNLTQGTGSSQPTVSGNFVVFSSDRFLNIPQASINNATSYSFFFVINPISNSNWIMVKQRNGINTYNLLSMTYNGYQTVGTTGFLYWKPFNAATSTNTGTALSTSTVQIIEIFYDGTNIIMYRNGTQISSTIATAAIQNDTSATNFTMGIWIPDGVIQNSGVTNFQLGEMTFYNTFVSTIQRQQMEGYLAWKWGLQGSLPANHPYKLFPPTS